MTRLVAAVFWAACSLGFFGPGVNAQESRAQDWNAAVNYWQAFGLMPEWTEDEKKIRDSIPEDLSQSLPPGVKELVGRSGAALSALESANRIDRCDWQLDYTLGPALTLPHLQKGRDLARQSLLRARVRLSEGDHAGGIADILAAVRLARALGSDQVLISMLVDAAIERPAIELAAAYLLQLNEAERKQLQAGWESLRAAPTLAQTLATEKKVFGGWLETQLEQEARGKNPEESAAGFFKTLIALSGSETDPQTAKVLESVGKASIETARQAVRQYLADCEELTRMASMDFVERKKRFAEFEKQLNSDNQQADLPGRKLSKLLLPAVGNVANAEESWAIRRKLLEAALAGVEGGEAGIAATAKKLGIELKSTSTAGGFELNGSFGPEGKKEMLKVGGGYRGKWGGEPLSSTNEEE